MPELKSWRISDFKAIDVAELRLPCLTILAGANSAGKSSIIQSLLMLAQTNSASEALVLNGPLIRLGLPKDVVRSGASVITLDFQIESSNETVNDRPELLTITISLAPSDDGKKLLATYIRITNDAEVVVLEATNKHLNGADESMLRARFFDSATVLRVAVLNGKKAPARSYVILSGISPVALAAHRSERQIRDSLNSLIRDSDGYSSFIASRAVGRQIQTLLQDPGDLSEDILVSLREVQVRDWTRPGAALQVLAALSIKQRSNLALLLSQHRSDGEFGIVELGSVGQRYAYNSRNLTQRNTDPVTLGAAADWATTTSRLSALAVSLGEFTGQIQYLGPLREEPRVLSSTWDQRTPSLPVGIRGELSAEVLTVRRNDKVSFHDWEGKKRRLPLPEAVGMWAHYLGIGEAVSVLDEGKLGRGVALKVNGVARDLTTIGVGASQLLPVLVACLVVEPHSVMIIEQPELHLHPAVQSRLGDFFLFARPDIRLLIETHSEYLVTRIRRRVAEERIERSALSFLFANQESGRTYIQSLELSQFGDFTEWPRGFFDEQDEEARGIIRAVAARVKAQQ